MAYNISWMDNSTTIADAFSNGLSMSVTGSTLSMGSVGLYLLVIFNVAAILVMSSRGLDLSKTFIVTGFLFTVIGSLLAILEVFSLVFISLFVVQIVAGVLLKGANGG